MRDESGPDDLQIRPLNVQAFGSAVLLSGPWGTDLALSAQAAEETGRMLIDGARAASTYPVANDEE